MLQGRCTQLGIQCERCVELEFAKTSKGSVCLRYSNSRQAHNPRSAELFIIADE